MIEDGQLTVAIGFRDGDLLRVEVAFRAEDWAARASAYAELHVVESFIADLRRFAATLEGDCALEAGDAAADGPLGLVALRLSALDGSGHLACHLRLRTSVPDRHRPEQAARVSVELRTEPALLDAFVEGATNLLGGSTALLLLVGGPTSA